VLRVNRPQTRLDAVVPVDQSHAQMLTILTAWTASQLLLQRLALGKCRQRVQGGKARKPWIPRRDRHRTMNALATSAHSKHGCEEGKKKSSTKTTFLRAPLTNVSTGA
jgi:hypothetical protein